MIAGKSVQEKKGELDMLEGKYAVISKEMGKKALKNKTQFVELMKKKAEKDSRRMIAKAKTEVRKNLLANKTKAIEAFDAYLHEEVKKFVSSKDYDSYLRDSFKKASREISPEETSRVILRAEDIALLPSTSFKIETSREMMGGFYLIVDDRIKYDYSIDGGLSEIRGYIGGLIDKIIEDEIGEHDENE
ncbi:MAG: V-type ATP synthase subunit E [Peptostreptococcaceae bacterium]|nr:V-type ATP synthase subunit E [Peptostreptococcaceae bacterium]